MTNEEQFTTSSMAVAEKEKIVKSVEYEILKVEN